MSVSFNKSPEPPPLARYVPLSRFTPRVGGGSARRSPGFATMRQIVAIAAALILGGLRLQAGDRTYEQRFSEECAKVGHAHSVSDVSLVDTNNQGPVFGTNALPFSRFRTAGELGGIKLGMTMSEVVAAWGKPRQLYTHCGVGPRFMYGRFASLVFRENRLVWISLSDRLLTGLVFDNGLKAGFRRPEVEALLGSSTPRLAKPADDWQSVYVSGGVRMTVSSSYVSRTPTEVGNISVEFDDEFNRRKSSERDAAPNAAPPHQ